MTDNITKDSEKKREIVDAISKNHYNPMNDAICKFIFGREERKSILIDFGAFKNLRGSHSHLSQKSLYT